MKDLLLQFAGVLGLLAAIIHGVLGETAVFAKARIEPERLRRLIRGVWQCSAVAWAGLAILLVAAPYMDLRRREFGSLASRSPFTASPQQPMPGARADGISDGWCSRPQSLLLWAGSSRI